jgi:hypothetical protein
VVQYRSLLEGPKERDHVILIRDHYGELTGSLSGRLMFLARYTDAGTKLEPGVQRCTGSLRWDKRT